MIVSRDLVSKNFDCVEGNKADLVGKIDTWKHILHEQCKAKKGESILIGLVVVNIDYLAICIAAAELSLKIVVVDYNRSDDFKDIEFYDSKTTLLSPIDIFLHDIPSDDLSECNKHNFFVNCAVRSYNIHEDIKRIYPTAKQLVELNKIQPDPSDIILRCTSSGTTGTPKIVEHTHEFMAAISKRNSKKFAGKCVHIKNLNHGSSIAVYLLPSLISDAVTEHVFYDVDEDIEFDGFVKDMEQHKENLEYIIFPYPYMIDKFIDASVRQNIAWPVLNVQTLSYIQDSAKQAIQQGTFKSITSIFG
jgi:acyl-CoA synthetase (AMP-forming)/AMP-acid ligase II